MASERLNNIYLDTDLKGNVNFLYEYKSLGKGEKSGYLKDLLMVGYAINQVSPLCVKMIAALVNDGRELEPSDVLKVLNLSLDMSASKPATAKPKPVTLQKKENKKDIEKTAKKDGFDALGD